MDLVGFEPTTQRFSVFCAYYLGRNPSDIQRKSGNRQYFLTPLPEAREAHARIAPETGRSPNDRRESLMPSRLFRVLLSLCVGLSWPAVAQLGPRTTADLAVACAAPSMSPGGFSCQDFLHGFFRGAVAGLVVAGDTRCGAGRHDIDAFKAALIRTLAAQPDLYGEHPYIVTSIAWMNLTGCRIPKSSGYWLEVQFVVVLKSDQGRVDISNARGRFRFGGKSECEAARSGMESGYGREMEGFLRAYFGRAGGSPAAVDVEVSSKCWEAFD